jgi:Penicillin V acylase and related amidases
MKQIKLLFVSLLVLTSLTSCKDIKSIKTISQVGDDEYLFSMEYCGKYDIDEMIASDISQNKELLDYATKKITRGLYNPAKKAAKAAESEASVNCTSFQAKQADGESFWYGRNYDMFKNPTLVLTNRPASGYASISTCDLSHLGYSLEKKPDSFKNKLVCLAAIYAPMDGINEKGLCTSIMALPKQPAQQSTGKHKIGTSLLMRLWLDRCATVQEALDLLATLDVNHDVQAGSGYHYMVADASGDCAVVEFDLEDGWNTMIVRKGADTTAMHVTNHLLSPKYNDGVENPKYGNPHSKSWWRYGEVKEYLNGHGGILTLDQAQECLSNVHWKDFVWDDGKFIEDTQWSNVYDQQNKKLYLRNWNNYENTVSFEL